jgi:hypothetical protein
MDDGARESKPAINIGALSIEDLDDLTLVQTCIGSVSVSVSLVQDAWRELVRRYEPLLRGMVTKRFARLTHRLPSDAADDVIGDLYVRILDDNMHALRKWVNLPRREALARWLGLIVNGIAIDHIRAARLRASVSLDGGSDDGEDRDGGSLADADPNRGGAWIGAERAADIGLEEDEPKRCRNRRSNDDIDNDGDAQNAAAETLPSTDDSDDGEREGAERTQPLDVDPSTDDDDESDASPADRPRGAMWIAAQRALAESAQDQPAGGDARTPNHHRE